MRKIIYSIIMTGMLSGLFSACGEYRDAAEGYVLGAAICALQGEDGDRSPYLSVVMPREFLEAKDFGRGRDGMYGSPPYRYDGEHAGAVDRYSRHDGRRRDFRDSGFSIFGKPDPPMLPDVTYEK